MNRPTLPHLVDLRRRLGLPGALGIALLCASAWATWQVLPGLRDEVRQQQEQVDHVRAQLKSGASGSPAASPGAADITALWQSAWHRLPPASNATALQAGVLQAARLHDLAVASVQYQGAGLKRLPQVWRQQMTLPVEGPYTAVKAWLVDILQEPALSVDAVELLRTDVMSDVVKARVSLSLWWRQEPRP